MTLQPLRDVVVQLAAKALLAEAQGVLPDDPRVEGQVGTTFDRRNQSCDRLPFEQHPSDPIDDCVQ